MRPNWVARGRQGIRKELDERELEERDEKGKEKW